jgi:hypothetical protein
MRISYLPSVFFVLLIFHTTPSKSQTAAAFGAVASSGHHLASAPMLHSGVYCIDYSGVSESAALIASARAGRSSPLDPNRVSLLQWENLLKQYDSYEKELTAAGILASQYGTAQQKLLQLSAASLSPLMKKDNSVAAKIKDLTGRDGLVKLQRQFDKYYTDKDNIDKITDDRNELGISMGLDPKSVPQSIISQEYVLKQFGPIYGAAALSDAIDPEAASHLMGRLVYFENVKTWNLPPKQLRAQAQAEYAFALFNNERYDEARAIAYSSLEVLGKTPEHYIVTDKDDEGHRRPAYSRNLAFMIAKFSEFQIARKKDDPLAGLEAAVEVLALSPALDHILWYLTDMRHWDQGKVTFNQILEHARNNLPIAINPKLPDKTSSALRQAVRAVWTDPTENKTFVTLATSIEGRPDFVSFAISGGAPPSPPAPPNVMQFSGNGGNGGYQFGFTGGEDGRKELLKFLRQEIDRHSTRDVALFAVLKEGDGFRVIVPTDRIAALKDLPNNDLKDFDTFTITNAEIDSLRSLSSDHPLSFVLAGLNGAALAMYTAPFAIVPGQFQEASDDFAFRLAAVHRDLPILRDYFTEETVPRSREMLSRPFGEASRYVVLTAARDTRLRDWGLVANIRKSHIDRFNIPVVTYDGKNAAELGLRLGGKDLNIIVITAHSAPDLQQMIYELGNAGAFKNNVVIFMSCRTEMTRRLTEVVGGYGAKGVVVTDQVVSRSDADATLRNLFEKFENDASKSRPFRQVIFEAFRNFGGLISVSMMGLWSRIHV